MTATAPFTIAQIAEMFRELGYKGRVQMGEGYSWIESSSSGCHFVAFCYGTDGAPVAQPEAYIDFIRFNGGWVDLVDHLESDLDGLCHWFNAGYPFSKLYRRNKEGGPTLTLEAEVALHEGMTAESLGKYFQQYVEHFEAVRRNLANCRTIDKAAILARHNRAIQLIHGAEKDPAEALDLYRQNAFLGYAGSQNNLGDLYEDGFGAPRDSLLAMHWYTRSAERGEPTAYFSVANLLFRSEDHEDAMVIAAMYAILASEKLPEGKNKSSAEMIRNELREQLDPALFQHAERLAAQYRPIYEERQTLSDTPGPKFIENGGSRRVN